MTSDGSMRIRNRSRRGKPTLKAVAEDAGVSISTVSHVVNGTRFVEESTTRRVKASIEKLGYAPNKLARSLRRLSTDTIGLVVSDIANPYYSGVIHGVEEECRRQGKTVLLAASDDDPAREEAAIETLREHQVDGLIVALTNGTTDRVLQEMSRFDIPVVLIDRFADLPVDQVGAENVESTATLVGHLVALGHRCIGFISGVEGISTSQERLTGYRSALAANGIAFDPNLVRSGNSRTEPARKATLALLEEVPGCTAIVSGNNLMTLGVMKAAIEMNRRVPDDLAVVAYDDFDWTEVFQPRLTTMAQPSQEIGRTAIELLQRRIVDPDAAVKLIRIPPTFVHRESCGRHEPA